MKKRMLSLLLAVCMLVAMLPVTMLASAADEVVYTYEFKKVAAYLNETYETAVFLKDKTSFTAAQVTEANVGSAPFYYENRSADFRWNGQLYMNGTNGGTSWTLFRITVGETGAYEVTLNYEGFGAQASPGAIYIAPKSAASLSKAIVDEYKAVEWERAVDKGEYVATSASNMALEAGEYNLWFYQDGTAGNDDVKQRYLAINNLVLTKKGEYPLTVSISGAPDELEKGDTAQLTAAVAPENFAQDVTWSSSNDAVASVDSTGLVTAKGKGTATITATSVYDPTVSAKVTITVTAPDYNFNFWAVGKMLYDQQADGKSVDLKWNDTMNYDNAAAAGSALWKHKVRSTNNPYFTHNGTDLYLNGKKGGISIYGLTIKIDEAGTYTGKFNYDVFTSSSPAKIYIAPAGTSESVAQTDQYLYFELLGSNTDANGWVAESKKDLVLEAGEYDLWICQIAEEDNDRYVVPKNLQLFKKEAAGDDNAALIAGLTGPSSAAMRYIAPMGQRFLSSISKDVVDQAVEFGTVLVPTEALTAGTTYTVEDVTVGATLNGYDVAAVPAVNYYGETDEKIEFTAVLIGIAPANYSRAITARAYAKLANGTYVYSTQSTSRSIYEIAQSFVNSDNPALAEAANKVINGEALQ